jgi:manganese transport protein
MNWIAKLFNGLIGPAAVIAAGTMGAGAVASLILAGAWFRYDLMWVILLMLPLFVTAVDSASRIGAVNHGTGMLSIVRRDIHPSVAWLLLLINVPIHLLVAMGQFSVMTSAFLSLFGMHPPSGASPTEYVTTYGWLELSISIGLGVAILWLVLSNGYDRIQKAMTVMMVAMFFCFLLIAMRSFGELGDILAGLVPHIPPDLPATGATRSSTGSIIAIVGSAIAPGALLVIPYLSSDAGSGASTLKRDLRKSILNLGFIFGAYAIFILIAGGYALYPMADHADIDTVHEAGQVLAAAFPQAVSGIGPTIFTIGLFIAALTTLIICVQVILYLTLDALGLDWAYTDDNRLYRRLLVIVTMAAGVLAPVWTFPALLKVVLLMGANVFVIPLVIAAVIYLLNRRSVMGTHTAGSLRNVLLVLALLVAIVLAADKFPDYLAMF